MSWQARRYLTQHHLTPKVRFKQKIETTFKRDSKENLLLLWNDRHELWHKLFGVLTLEEIIEVLQRISKLKHRA